MSVFTAHADNPTPTVGQVHCGYNATFAPGSDAVSGTIIVGTGGMTMQCYITLAPAGFWVGDPTCTPDFSTNGVPLYPMTYAAGNGEEYLDYVADDILQAGDTIPYTCTGTHN